LARPHNWEEISDVTRTNDRVISTSYISTTGGWAAVNSVTRGTAFNAVDIAETAETLTISTGRDVPVFVDWADLYQSPWTKPAEAAKRSAQRLDEFTETDVLDDHGSWRNIGGSGGSWTDNVSTTLAVSASNVDDLVRLVRQVIRVQNGQDLAAENGIFHVWDPASFNFLEAFAQANGYESADMALQKGLAPQVSYMGATHYVTNDNAANHLFAGVRKLHRVGLLLSLEGRSHTIEFPAGSSGGNLSGVTFYVRREEGTLTPTSQANLLFDINIA
jgi:hypothetical protein